MSFGSERSREGLPTADEYEPDAIGKARLSAGDPEQTWPEYGLEMVPVMHNDQDTGRRLIRQNGNFISDVSDEYKLLPNERVVEAANEVARDLGAEPFHDFDGEWFINLDDHVYQDPERRRVHALYAWESGTVGQDDMEYGFAVHNSIDGSLAFKVALFSFRHACANMVNIGTGGYRDRMAQNVESEREVLAESEHRHTSGLDVEVDMLKALVKGNLSLLNTVNEAYNDWAEDVVQPQHIESIFSQRFPQKTLPEWVRNAQEVMEEEREERREFEGQEVQLPAEQRADIIEARIPTGETVWDTYNDMTQAIWHSDRTSDSTKQNRMAKVHRVFDPLDA